MNPPTGCPALGPAICNPEIFHVPQDIVGQPGGRPVNSLDELPVYEELPADFQARVYVAEVCVKRTLAPMSREIAVTGSCDTNLINEETKKVTAYYTRPEKSFFVLDDKNESEYSRLYNEISRREPSTAYDRHGSRPIGLATDTSHKRLYVIYDAIADANANGKYFPANESVPDYSFESTEKAVPFALLIWSNLLTADMARMDGNSVRLTALTPEIVDDLAETLGGDGPKEDDGSRPVAVGSTGALFLKHKRSVENFGPTEGEKQFERFLEMGGYNYIHVVNIAQVSQMRLDLIEDYGTQEGERRFEVLRRVILPKKYWHYPIPTNPQLIEDFLTRLDKVVKRPPLVSSETMGFGIAGILSAGLAVTVWVAARAKAWQDYSGSAASPIGDIRMAAWSAYNALLQGASALDAYASNFFGGGGSGIAKQAIDLAEAEALLTQVGETQGLSGQALQDFVKAGLEKIREHAAKLGTKRELIDELSQFLAAHGPEIRTAIGVSVATAATAASEVWTAFVSFGTLHSLEAGGVAAVGSAEWLAEWSLKLRLAGFAAATGSASFFFLPRSAYETLHPEQKVY